MRGDRGCAGPGREDVGGVNAESVSHYRLLRRLGHGGMAEVYEALDVGTERRVALKVLLPHLCADPVIRERFVREGRIGMELDHPGIVRTFEADEADGRPYLAMEFVTGMTLEQAMNERRLDLEQSLAVVCQVADALATAHGRGIVHRDIKPRNIMLTDGGIKVMDFGLARVLVESSITGQREIVGTLHYMSPEQALGSAVDARSDIFSLGVVFYHLISGSLPFAGEHPGAVIHAILYSDPMRIAELGLAVPVEIEQVVFKALRKKPQARYQSAAELRSDIEAARSLLQGMSVRLIATEEVFEESTPGVYSELVGREQEMALLTGCLARMLQGEGTTVLVSGEAGIGKSRLVWELGRRARRQHARYMLGRCRFGERGYPYQPLIEVLRGWFGLKGVGKEPRLGGFLEERAPHLSARKDIIQALLLTGSDRQLALVNKDQLWDTIAELVKLMARDRPVVLHMDDLHWADAPTLDLLAYLAMNTRSDRVMIVGTYRPEELADVPEGTRHPLERTLALLAKEGLAREIRLERLDRQGTQGVVDSVFSGSRFPDRFYDSVHGETEGNPLFVHEVLKYLRDEGIVARDNGGWKLDSEVIRISVPGRVTDVIRNRLSRLSRGELEMLQVAAVEGYTFQSDTVCEVLELPRLNVLRRLQNFESSHHLVHARENEYQFDHGKIQETIYSDMTPELRKEHHRLVAEHYVRVYGDRGEHAGRIALHFLEADRKRNALPYLVAAGRYAQSLFARDEALATLDRASGLTEELRTEMGPADYYHLLTSILKTRAEVHLAVDDYDSALSDFRQVVKLSEESGDRFERAAGMHGIGVAVLKKGDYVEGMHWCELALCLQRELGDREGEGRSLYSVGVAHWERGYLDKAAGCFSRALEIARATGDDLLRANCLKKTGAIAHIVGAYQDAIDKSIEALDVFRRHGRLDDEAECLHLVSINAAFLPDYEKAFRYADEAIAVCQRIGNRFFEAWSYLDKSFVCRGLGQTAEAIDFGNRALDLFTRIGSGWGMSRALLFLTWVHAEVDDYERTREDGSRGLEVSRQVGDKINEGGMLYKMAFVSFRTGRYAQALDYFKQAEPGVRQFGAHEVKWDFFNSISRFWLDIGDIQRARGYLDEFRLMNEQSGTGISWSHYWTDCGYAELLGGSLEKAGFCADKALALGRSTANVRCTAEALLLNSRLKLMRQDLESAEAAAREGVILSARAARLRNLSELKLLLSYVSLQQRDWSSAGLLAEEALRLADQCQAKPLIWQARHVLGKIHMKNGDFTQARTELKQAEDVVKSIVEGLSDELKVLYLARPAYRDLQVDMRAVA